MKRKKPDKAAIYRSFGDLAYLKEAEVIQQRINNHKNQGIPVNSEQVWQWIKERNADWWEIDWNKVYKLVRL